MLQAQGDGKYWVCLEDFPGICGMIEINESTELYVPANLVPATIKSGNQSEDSPGIKTSAAEVQMVTQSSPLDPSVFPADLNF